MIWKTNLICHLPLLRPNTTQTNEISKNNSKQACNSRFMHVFCQDIVQPNNENFKRKLGLNIKHNKMSFEILEALKDIYFSKTYFSNK